MGYCHLRFYAAESRPRELLGKIAQKLPGCFLIFVAIFNA